MPLCISLPLPPTCLCAISPPPPLFQAPLPVLARPLVSAVISAQYSASGALHNEWLVAQLGFGE